MELQEFIIPQEIKDLTLPDPDELTYWSLRKQRCFWIDFELEGDYYHILEIGKIIVQMNMEEKDIPENELKPIFLYIFSYGGDLDSANAFIDICEMSRIPIVTVSAGASMSAGLLIFLAGKRRYAFKKTQILIHSGSASFGGTAEQIEEAQKSYKKQVNRMKEYIISHSHIDEKLFNKNRTKDWYVTGDEIVELGLADKIVERFEDIQ